MGTADKVEYNEMLCIVDGKYGKICPKLMRPQDTVIMMNVSQLSFSAFVWLWIGSDLLPEVYLSAAGIAQMQGQRYEVTMTFVVRRDEGNFPCLQTLFWIIIIIYD